MKDYFTLKVLDRFAGLFVKAGVDYKLMRRILQLKLTMDRRRMPTIISLNATSGRSGEGEADERNLFGRSLLLYGLFGLFMMMIVLMGDNYLFQMSLLFGSLMFMIIMSMISDFSAVLLDLRDRTILGTRPVDRRTINTAKTMHVLVYLLSITAALALPSLIAGMLRHGLLFALLFLVGLILMNFFIIFITALLYLLILKFFDGERLKDTINYVQIGLSIVITVGFQVAAHSFNFANFAVVLEPQWWQLFIVPIWFGAGFELLQGAASPYLLIQAGLALVVPVLSIFIYIRMAPAFERSLQKLASHSTGSGRSGGKWGGQLGKRLCTTQQERAYFRFAWNMLRAEREFKLKVYPSIGLSFIIPFILLFQASRMMTLQELAGTSWFLTIYFCAILIPSVLLMLKYSGSHKGAFIYQIVPGVERGAAYRGAVKAALLRLFVPVLLMTGAVYTALFGLRFVPQLAVIVLAMGLFTFVCGAAYGKQLPFSLPFERTASGGFMMIVYMLLLAALVGLHLLAALLPYGLLLYGAALLGANIGLWRKIHQRKE